MFKVGWSSLEAEDLGRLDEDDLEKLVHDLVTAEVIDRWGPGAVDLEGPQRRKVNDGGCDFVASASKRPNVSPETYVERWRVPFTWLGDGAGVHVFSCKSGPSSVDKAKSDAATASQKLVIARLRAGATFTLVTNQNLAIVPGKKTAASNVNTRKEGLRRDLAEKYHAHLGGDLEALTSRIRVVDAQDLATWLRMRRPIEVREALRTKLGVRRFQNLLSLDSWRTVEERPRTPFVDDPTRSTHMSALREWADVSDDTGGDDTAWVVGAPGVGKTRFVMESLAGREARVAVARDTPAAITAIDEGLFDAFPSCLLVVDDCSTNIRPLIKAFRTATDDDNHSPRLLAITPAARDVDPELTPPRVRRFDMEPLAEAACLSLVRRVASGLEDAKVEWIVRMTEGFPWFIILVAGGVAAGDPMPKSATDAARLALVPADWRGDTDARRHEVLRRARALLVVMLIGRQDWQHIGDETRERLAKGVGLETWAEAERAIHDCAARGLVRAVYFRYVTPRILEREVWRILVTPGGPGGLSLARLQERAAEFVPPLIARLEAIGLRSEELADAAASLSTAATSGLDPSLPGRASSHLLEFVAQYAPERIGGALARYASALPDDRVRAELPAFARALQLVAERGVAFPEVTGALLRLDVARHDDLRGLQHAASPPLLSPWFDLPRVPYEERFRVVTRSAASTDWRERRFAAALVGAAVATRDRFTLHLRPPVVAFADGPTVSARISRLREVVAGLLSDPRAEVAEAARAQWIELTLHALTARLPLPPRDSLLAEAARLTPDPRQELRKRIEVATWAKHIPAGAHREAAEALLRAASPETLLDRLRARVMVDAVVAWDDPERTEEEDLAVARDVLSAAPSTLAEALGWLDSTANGRVNEFMVLLGRLDDGLALLPHLFDGAEDPQRADLLGLYCAGHVDAGRRPAVEAWLFEWRREPRLTRALVWAIVRTSPNDALLAIVDAFVRDRIFPPDLYGPLAWGVWAEVTHEALATLCSSLVATGDAAAIDVVLARLTRGAASLPQDAALLLRAMRALPSRVHQHFHWKRAGELLLAHGFGGEVCDVALGAALQDDEPHEAWALLSQCAERAPQECWALLSPVFEREASESLLWWMRVHWHPLIERLPEAPILAWVGDDADRAWRIALALHVSMGPIAPLAVALVARFGAGSAPATELAARVGSTPSAVNSLASFYEERAADVEPLTRHENSSVREWAQGMLREFERSRQWHQEEEASDRRHFGT